MAREQDAAIIPSTCWTSQVRELTDNLYPVNLRTALLHPVRRRPIHAGNRLVEQAQIDAQLRAVVNQWLITISRKTWQRG